MLNDLSRHQIALEFMEFSNYDFLMAYHWKRSAVTAVHHCFTYEPHHAKMCLGGFLTR